MIVKKIKHDDELSYINLPDGVVISHEYLDDGGHFNEYIKGIQYNETTKEIEPIAADPIAHDSIQVRDYLYALNMHGGCLLEFYYEDTDDTGAKRVSNSAQWVPGNHYDPENDTYIKI